MQRDVAQLGSAPLWGSGGLGFKSQHSDSFGRLEIINTDQKP